MQPFKNLRVLELASVLAGPAVGLFFAELGATVIKIENQRTGGDVTRKWKHPNEPQASNLSAYYCSVNWNKEVRMLNLTQATDQEEIHNLIPTIDVVIANFKPGSAQKLKMDYATLKAINPKLIYASLSAFGEHSNRVGFDVVLQAEAGFLFMNGAPSGNPVKMPVALIDLLAAHQLKEGILIALLNRVTTGKGAFVEASLLDAAIASLANQATNWLMAQHIPQRMGSAHPNIAPYGDMFLTKDEKTILIAVGTEKQFRSLCSLLEVEHLVRDPRFESNAARVKNRRALVEALEQPFKKWESTSLLEHMHQLGIPAGSIRNMQEVFELPEAQDLILEEMLPDGRISRRVKTAVFSIKGDT